MRPTKTKELYPQIAAATGCTEEEVKAVSESFWSYVRESLSNLKDVRIHLHNLGDFTIKHWLIEKEIDRNKNMMAYRTQLTGPLTTRVTKLENALKIYQEEVQRKEFIYNHKKLSNENKSRKSSEGLEK